jgi:hypothetical protein
MQRFHFPTSILFAAVGVMFTLAGCGGAKHVPATASARQALETALAAWRDGKPVGIVQPAGPAINAEDGDWRAKRKLTAFEILGEEPNQPADAPRRFNVKLTHEDGKSVEAVFVVFGNDPIQVYRDKDYELHFNKM